MVNGGGKIKAYLCNKSDEMNQNKDFFNRCYYYIK